MESGPAGRGASLPACPLQPASCPEDREALRNWKRVLQDRALVGAKVAGSGADLLVQAGQVFSLRPSGPYGGVASGASHHE